MSNFLQEYLPEVSDASLRRIVTIFSLILAYGWYPIRPKPNRPPL